MGALKAGLQLRASCPPLAWSAQPTPCRNLNVVALLELPQPQDLPICGTKVPEPPQHNAQTSWIHKSQAVYKAVHMFPLRYILFFERMEMQIHLTLLNSIQLFVVTYFLPLIGTKIRNMSYRGSQKCLTLKRSLLDNEWNILHFLNRN